MALSLSTQSITSGSFGTFVNGMALNGTTFYPAVSLLTAAGTLFDPATLALESGGNLAALVTASATALPSGTNIIGDIRNITGSVPLPTGAATLAGQVSPLAQATATSGKTGALMMGMVTTAAPTYSTTTINGISLTTAGETRVAAASLPLPAGASTAAKQPALGTAGTASADVITIQGIASMTAVLVDASASASLPLPTGAATSALQPSNITPATAIAGLTGPMMQVETLTSDPTYTTATVNPLHANLFGHLRMCNGSISQAQTPVVTSNGAYTAGQILGTKLTYSYSATAGTIQSISVTSESLLTATLTAYLFHTSTTGTYTDKTAPAIAQADKARLLAVVPLDNPSNGFGTHTCWWKSGLNLNVANSTFYVFLVATDALTLTASSTSEIVCRLTIRL